MYTSVITNSSKASQMNHLHPVDFDSKSSKYSRRSKRAVSKSSDPNFNKTGVCHH